jgi:hypothetical protein
MILNINIPYFKCLIRRSHYTHDKNDYNTYDNAYAFGIQSIAGKILTFHIMTDFGMLRSRVPISEIFIKEPIKDIPFHYKQLWDCFSENVTVTEYSFLKENKCQVILKDKTKIWATYLFTIDWFDNPYSNEPTDYKAGHILIGDDGYLLCQPNNRIFWKDSNWITKSFPVDPKQIKVDKILHSVESVSDKWISDDDDSFYYNMNETYI